jgi:uncharacterized peroxidase-related enzyme
MAHIELPAGLPGIRGPLAFSPATSKPIRDLAQVLLHDPNTLSPGERELIAAYVSARNECVYCDNSHSATAACHLGNDESLVAQVKRDPESAPISDKMKALLAIAGRVQKSGREVTGADVDRARRHGATDKEIHDTVLIAAAFCMFNRYVDGLATFTPKNPEFYRESAANIVAHGYADPGWPRPTHTLDGEIPAAAEGLSGKR